MVVDVSILLDVGLLIGGVALLIVLILWLFRVADPFWFLRVWIYRFPDGTKVTAPAYDSTGRPIPPPSIIPERPPPRPPRQIPTFIHNFVEAIRPPPEPEARSLSLLPEE